MKLELYSNNGISSHTRCPRYYYYSTQRRWRPDRLAAPLGFGLAWHAAMDAVWVAIKEGFSDEEVVAVGLDAWLNEWTDQGFPRHIDMTDDQAHSFGARHEYTAQDMIISYVSKRRGFIESIEIIEVERPFAVPLSADDPNLFYIGRIDKVVRWQGRIWGIEHKTSSEYKKDGYFKSQFIESFSPNRQIDGYIHALHMLYGDEAKGILVDAALVHKTVHDGFMFIPVERMFEMLDQWLWQTNKEIEKIQRNVEDLRGWNQKDERSAFMPAFEQYDTSCSHYGACPYLNICKGISNPAAEQQPPMGYIEHVDDTFRQKIIEELKLGEG